MRLPLLLSLVLLSQTSAFQTAPHPHPPRTATCLQSELRNEPQEPVKKLILPRTTKRRLLSKLTTSPLSALTQLKKDERNKFNKERLLKMGITMMAFMTAFKKAPLARAAATPLIVTKGGAITPLIASPGLGIVEMPGMRGISPYQIGRLPNQGAWFFALALFVTATLLREAGNGYVRFVHFVAKHMVSMIKEDDEDINIGLPKETDWDQYSHSMLDPLQKKKVEKISDYKFDPRTFLFLRVNKAGVDHDAEDAKLQKANQFFREQKYKQHHHPVHVSHSKYEQTAYLDALAINGEERHDVPRGYLDTLSDAKASTWGVYKHQLADAKPASDVDELKQDVSNLQSLMQIEQSMYQTSNQALKLAMEAQSEERQHTSTNQDLKEFDQKLSTSEELKAFDKKAEEFENTVVKDAAKMKKVEDISKETNPSA